MSIEFEVLEMADVDFTVPLKNLIKDLRLEEVYLPVEAFKRIISSADVNRPGLQLVGFFDYFDERRIQIFGQVENTFLETFTEEQRIECFDKLFSRNIPAVIITRNHEIYNEMLISAKKYGIPILRTTDTTSYFMSSLNSYLNLQLAPRITRHGVLMEVYGEGTLILGESGVGKSETAVELLKRGHRLIADDAVEIKRVSNKTLVGAAPDIIKHFIEIRGIGIINVRRIFGIGAVKESEKIELVINLEIWDENKQYDRLGMDNEYTEILGLRIPSHTIPIKPGRNLAMILEVAAMNNRQKRLGYNGAQDLSKRFNEKFVVGGEDIL